MICCFRQLLYTSRVNKVSSTLMATTSASATNISVSFSIGERVLCFHGPLIYEAKILKTENFTETTTTTGLLGPHYFVHYKGWKQT